MIVIRFYIEALIWVVWITILAGLADVIFGSGMSGRMFLLYALLVIPLYGARTYLRRRTVMLHYVAYASKAKTKKGIAKAVVYTIFLAILIYFIIDSQHENFQKGGLILSSLILLLIGIVYLHKKWK